jgi:spore germination protein KC
MKRAISIIMLISLLFATGCWDRTEINDLALEMGWGLDKAEGGQIQSSAQVVIPSKMKTEGSGGGGKPYFVVFGTGRTTLEAAQDMQAKLSRKVLRSHRRVLLIGEPLAQQGLENILDTYARDPEVRLRTDVFVTQNNTAKDFLEIPYPLETIPAIGALKEHTSMGGFGNIVLLNFLLDASTEGSCPTLPIMKATTSGKEADQPDGFAYAGRALFDKNLKMVGSVSAPEAQLMFWVKSANKYLTIAGYIPEGNGAVSIDMIRPKGKIEPVMKGGKLTFQVLLISKGAIRENNTNFDLRQRQNLKVVESVLESESAKRVKQLITKVQKEYGTDVFGFGEAVHRKYPYKWKQMKKDWDRQFSEADISVTAQITIQRVGLTGPPLQLKDKRIRK